MNSDERLASFLLNLSLRFSTRGYSSKNFVLKMRREEIGSYLGLRLETICRGIAHLRDQGLVSIAGRNVTILNWALDVILIVSKSSVRRYLRGRTSGSLIGIGGYPGRHLIFISC